MGEFHPRTLAEWTRIKGDSCPVERSGRPGQANLYEYLAVLEWYAGHFAAANGEEAPEHPPSHSDLPERRESDRKLAHWKASNERLRYLEAAGQLTSVLGVQREAAATYAAIREALLSIPAHLRDDLADTEDAVECETLVKNAIEVALNAYSSQTQITRQNDRAG